ncbi:unnamed protein product [Phyllotreta striolata]|uniref:Uncharacterized protein n=1 Tax=Phyllotreta striolata TaxID=444603 RepID=A0A9N9XPJ7_PHYSR|nr:unnamed protein product [Phyllotreta striolata]
MEELLGHISKIISNHIAIHLYSYPHFSVEILLAVALCVSQLLLIFELNDIFKRTNTRAIENLRIQHPQALKQITANGSLNSLSRIETQVFPQKIETTTTRQSYYAPFSRRAARKASTRSNVGWLVPKRRSSMLNNPHLDRVEHLLAMTPSDYVRQDRERKEREAGLKSCIHSLTSLLERALSAESGLESESKEAIRRSLMSLRSNFDGRLFHNHLWISSSDCGDGKTVKRSRDGDDGASDFDEFYVDRSFEVIRDDRRKRN